MLAGMTRIAENFEGGIFPDNWKSAFEAVTDSAVTSSDCPPPLAVFLLTDVHRFWNCDWWCGELDNEAIAVALWSKYRKEVSGEERRYAREERSGEERDPWTALSGRWKRGPER